MATIVRPDCTHPAMIPFTRAVTAGSELDYLSEAIARGALSAGGVFGQRCERWLEAQLGVPRALLVHSCTAALEMAALLLDLGPGDEVIMPSFTFASTANAFVLRGAVPVFVDIRPDTLNLDENEVERAITARTRAIVPVHYAGVPCAMEALATIALRHGLRIIEDAAQALGATYLGRPLGSLGDMGCLSFHDTKNVIAGEGGALLINDPALIERAEVLRDKGTDRAQFLRGEVDRYTWRDLGSSYGPSELNAAFLLAQLEACAAITEHRRRVFECYAQGLAELAQHGALTLPTYGAEVGNAHIFWVLLPNAAARHQALACLREAGVQATTHYVPLHSAPAGRRYGRAVGDLPVTVDVADRLLRLPMHAEIDSVLAERVVNAVRQSVRRRPWAGNVPAGAVNLPGEALTASY